ncbi:hypothetical protein WME77_34420 [Sorangium sp. So ce764]|uniref:hypothetical protein n=1 Tax=Sorangium sp. So ce764 TaxID=3133320 RepID=UPI003F638AAA
MSLFSKRVLPVTLLGAAAVIGGCVGDASREGDDELETQAEAADPESADAIDPEAAEAVGTAQQALETTWWCINRAEYVGKVTIWWGHTAVDATWACNEWIETCRNRGGCGSFRLNF